MKMDIRHRFDCTPDEFWQMYWDDAFAEQLNEGSSVQRELVEERIEGDLLVRRIKFTPQQELPSAAASILGATRLEYEQENRYDQVAKILQWRVIPTILPGKLCASGTVEVHPAGSGCEQVVAGEIKVQVPLIGGRIEKAVVAEVEKSWNRTAEVCRGWLARGSADV